MNGLIWLGMHFSSGLLWTRYYAFSFHKIRRISRQAEWLSAFQEGPVVLR